MKVYALVGKSGTGKSYKALNVAYEKNIDLVIDDGLLIHGNKLLAGKSAKRENTTIGAVKRAIFHFEDHRKVIINEINKKNYDSILILGTSVRMVEKIAKNLKLGKIDEFVFIKDISSKEEIELAKHHRIKKGRHIIPLPTLELKKHFSGYLLDAIKHILRRDNNEVALGEKTVTKPTFSYFGKFSISNNTIRDIVYFTALKDESIAVDKIKIEKKEDSVIITVGIVVTYGHILPKKAIVLQRDIIKQVDQMTNINILSCNIIIKDLKE